MSFMQANKRNSIPVFGETIKGVAKTNMFGAINSKQGISTFNANTPSNILTIAQYNALVTVQQQYSGNLASKSYTNIPSNPGLYRSLLLQLKEVRVTNPHLMYLMRIAMNILAGSMNASTLYSNYAITEINLNTIQKRIDEILSNINMKESSGATGQFSFTKNVSLSPIFNYYILLFGMPAYGVGFDINKLSFLKSLPIFSHLS